MSKIDKSDLGDYLLQCANAEIDEIEALDYSSVTVTEQFKERIKSSAKSEKKLPTTKKMLVFFVAAILVSLSVIFVAFAATRNGIFSFFVEIFDDTVEVTIVDNSTTTISSDNDKSSYPKVVETEYIPAYISENNYLRIDKISLGSSVMTVWTNGDIIIDLSQQVIDKTTISLDKESDHQIIYVDTHEVILSHKYGVYIAIWVENGYLFTISCDDILGIDNLKAVISSMAPIDN